MKRLVFLLLGLTFLISACQRPNLLEAVAFYPDDAFAYQTFSLDELQLELFYERGPSQIIPFDVAYLEETDPSLINVPGSHPLTLTVEGITTTLTLTLHAPEAWVSLGTFYLTQREASLTELDFETWLASLRGEDGRGIADVRVEDNRWFLILDDDSELALGDLRGTPGVDGVTPLVFVEDQQLKVRVGETTETLLDLSELKPKEVVSLRLTESNEVVVTYDDLSVETMGALNVSASALAIQDIAVINGNLTLTLGDGTVFNAGSVIGPQGPRGLTGIQGPAGAKVEFRLSTEGLLQFKYEGDPATAWQTLINTEDLIGPQGLEAPKVEFRQVAERLEWKYNDEPDSAYRVLTTLDDFQGPPGDPGTLLELRFNAEETELEFRYAGEDVWQTLLDVELLQGLPGVGLLLQVSGSSIVWAQETDDPVFSELLPLDSLRGPATEFLVFDDETIKYRTVGDDDSAWQTVISLSAIQGTQGVTGRGIHAVTLSGSALLIAYDDAPDVFIEIGSVPPQSLVVFRLPSGIVIDVQKIPHGQNALTPTGFSVPFGTTVAGFSNDFSVITQALDVTVQLTFEDLTVTFENTTLPALTLTSADSLRLPLPEAPYLHEFVGWTQLRNGIPVRITDGFSLESLFYQSSQVTLFPEFRRFKNTTEEARIAMLDQALAATLTIFNNAPSDKQFVGSGVIYRQEKISETEYHYWAVTNEHVIEDFISVDVEYALNGHRFSVTDVHVLGFDAINDVAVISFSALHTITPLTFADTTRLQTGQVVYALGSPLGSLFYRSVASGTLIGIRRSGIPFYTDAYFIQHDAAINPGNSGGPLIDSNGEIVGLNTWKLFQASDDRDTEGLGFAITGLLVQRVIADIEAGTSLDRRVLGITSQAITACEPNATFGVCIDTITPNSVAESLGLQSGDIIVAYQHARMPQISPIPNVDVLREYLFSTRLNEVFTVYFVRNGLDVSATYTP